MKPEHDAGETAARPLARVGVIGNPRSHRNKGGLRPTGLPEAVIYKHEPSSRPELYRYMREFKADAIDMLVIDGGDGTVRDVLSVARDVFGQNLPQIGVIPSGKTNALAFDLGIPRGWQVGDAVRAHQENRTKTRSGIEVHWTDGHRPSQMGFIFGLGVFGRATMLAQRVHKRGIFNSLAVFFTLVIGLFKTMVGRDLNSWRRGDMVWLSGDGEGSRGRRFYMIFGSTLRRMPLGLKPFGRKRDGMKFLLIDAPPKALHRHVFPVLRGAERTGLEENGYRRRDVDRLTMRIGKSFVLDGEQFPGGTITLSKSEPITFVVPEPC